MNPNEKKEIYVTPLLDVVTFELSDSIAVSGESISGLICGEEMQ